ncbi:MAG: hypothetical protein ACYTEL_08830 [Planctomycetota bacterium]|jgi:hypothetical protein
MPEARQKSKPERTKEPDSKVRKKRRLKIICWLAFDLVLVAGTLTLLLYKPGRYHPSEYPDDRVVSPYLTNVLGPAFNNGVQRGEPFYLLVEQKGINETLAWYYKHKWPNQFGEVGFSAPEILFLADTIVLMGTVTLRGVDFVVTVEARPYIDEKQLLRLNVTKLKVGAMNVTPVARVIARRMYNRQVTDFPVDRDDIRTKIVAALLTNEPFEPIFPVKGLPNRGKIDVRLAQFKIEPEKLTLLLVPQ